MRIAGRAQERGIAVSHYHPASEVRLAVADVTYFSHCGVP
jgi:hypothetical protein